MSAVSVSEPEVRPVLVDAAGLARRALVELEPNGVGTHLGVTAEGDSAATHRFESTLPGYRGWQWAVVVAAPPDAEHATVSESALLPGPEALVAPDFIPWEQRIRPGDLAPGDLLAPPADDPRLVPGYVANGDPEIDDLAREVGLGRTKVLSPEGRAEAAERWYAEHGPDTDMAKAAPGTCGTCGFYLPLAGALRAAFGVCGNAMGADGTVVHVDYGCGAHSDVELPTGGGSPRYEAYDDAAVDLVPAEELRRRVTADSAPSAESAPDRAPSDGAAEQPSTSANAVPESATGHETATPTGVPTDSMTGEVSPEGDAAPAGGSAESATGEVSPEDAAPAGAAAESATAGQDAGSSDAFAEAGTSEASAAQANAEPTADAADQEAPVTGEQVGAEVSDSARVDETGADSPESSSAPN